MHDRLYMLATTLILIGFAMLCQPVSPRLFSYGFPVLVAGLGLHIILDHWPRKRGNPGGEE